MAEITRKRAGELVRGVFRILLNEREGLPAKEVLQRLAVSVPPTPFEQSTYPNRPNDRRFDKIVRFSTIAAVKAGWLQKNKGSWSLSDEGGKAFETFSDPEAFDREARRLYREWRADQPHEDIQEQEPVASVQAATTLEEAEEAAWSEIEKFLEQMSPYDFQEL